MNHLNKERVFRVGCWLEWRLTCSLEHVSQQEQLHQKRNQNLKMLRHFSFTSLNADNWDFGSLKAGQAREQTRACIFRKRSESTRSRCHKAHHKPFI